LSNSRKTSAGTSTGSYGTRPSGIVPSDAQASSISTTRPRPVAIYDNQQQYNIRNYNREYGYRQNSHSDGNFYVTYPSQSSPLSRSAMESKQFELLL